MKTILNAEFEQVKQDSTEKKFVSLIKGDGIGPEIAGSVLTILKAADVNIEFEEIEAGEKVYLSGQTSGLNPNAWENLRKNKVLLKAPITTPRGSGYKSLNVTIRKTLGLYANVRPARTYDPFIPTRHPDTDLVIIRENEEDTYAGIEHRQTREVTQCLKLITRPGSEKIIRYAFEFARANGRHCVTCMVKDNIMKITDGLFQSLFKEISAEYPEIESESMIIDIGTALVADQPRRFDVIVTPNLYGDIISDVAAQITGSVGLCGSANIGEHIAMFEAVHGSAPDIAGKDIANPSAFLEAAILMLIHLGKSDKAKLIRNAWLKTLEDGFRTKDIFEETQPGTKLVGTKEFTKAVVERLGEIPKHLKASEPKTVEQYKSNTIRAKEIKELVGVDIFIDWSENRNPEKIGKVIEGICPSSLKLKMITNRGVKVYPEGQPETFLTDHWRCRFVSSSGQNITHSHILMLLGKFDEEGIDFIKTENLYKFDGKPGYSLGQGE
jgi:isocitrate dehydrogenase